MNTEIVLKTKLVIDTITKTITPKYRTSKVIHVTQGDHNSVLIPFEITRYVDGQDMSAEGNVIHIHYANVAEDDITKFSNGVSDACKIEVDENTLTFYWRVPNTATRYAGTMSIGVTFSRYENDGGKIQEEYSWSTAPFGKINVWDKLDNSGEVAEREYNYLIDTCNAIVETAIKEEFSKEIEEAVTSAFTQAKESGEFNGKDGKDGKTPDIGENGNWWIGGEDTGIIATVVNKIGSYEEFFNGTKKGNILRYSDARGEETLLPGNYDFYTTDYIKVYSGDVLYYKLSGIVGVQNVISSLFHVYNSTKELKEYIRPEKSNTLTEGKYRFAEDGYIRLCHGVYNPTTTDEQEALHSGEVYIQRGDLNNVLNKKINGDKFNIAVLSDSIFSLVGGSDALSNKTTVLDYLKEKVDCNYFNCAVHGSCAGGTSCLSFWKLAEAINSNDFAKQITELGTVESDNSGVVIYNPMPIFAKLSCLTNVTNTGTFALSDGKWKLTSGSRLWTFDTLDNAGIRLTDTTLTSFTVTRTRNATYQSHVASHLQTIIDLCNGTNVSEKNPENKTWSDIDILVVNYGANDFSRKVTTDETKVALIDGIKQLLTKYPNLRIAVSAPYYQFETQEIGNVTYENGKGVDSVTLNKMDKVNLLNGNYYTETEDGFKFVYNGTSWTFNGKAVDLSTYDITVTTNSSLDKDSYFVIKLAFKDSTTLKHNGTDLLKDYTVAVKESAEKLHLPFFDNLTHFGWNRYNKINYFSRADGYHPIEAGAHYMANKLYENLKASGLLGIKKE